MQSDTTGFLQEFHKILEEAGKKGASDIHYVPKEQLLLHACCGVPGHSLGRLPLFFILTSFWFPPAK